MAKKRGGGGPTVGKTRPKKGSPPPPTRPVQRGQYKPADYDLEEYLREISPDNGRGGLARDLSDIGLLPETDDAGIRRPLLMGREPLELGPDWLGDDIDADWWGRHIVDQPGGSSRLRVLDRTYEPDLREWPDYRPEEYPEDNVLNFDAAGGLMDLLQTPGFKIGLGGTAALTALLSYLGANVVEEITP